jgi:hypothetical protein
VEGSLNVQIEFSCRGRPYLIGIVCCRAELITISSYKVNFAINN